MKILAINGSHHGTQGHTHFLVEQLFKGASEAGADCETVTLSRLKINRCLACDQCQQPERYLQCVQKDDVSAVFAKIAAADMLIYATPIYVFGLSSLLKTLIERQYGSSDCADLRVTPSGLMFHHINPAIASKPFVTLICCDNLENKTPQNALAYFKTYSQFMNAPQVGVLVRNAGALRQAAMPGIQARYQAVYAAYVQAGRELAQQGHISRATQRKANQEVIPVPLFGLLKCLPLKPLKRQFVSASSKFKTAAATKS